MGTRESLEEAKVVDAFSNQTVSATLGSDTSGAEVDRDDQSMPRVVKVVLDGQGDLGDASDDLKFDLQHDDDNGSGSPDGSWEDTGDTISLTNSDKRVVREIRLDDKKRHIRLNLDSGDSTLAADAEVAGEFVLAGGKKNPQ